MADTAGQYLNMSCTITRHILLLCTRLHSHICSTSQGRMDHSGETDRRHLLTLITWPALPHTQQTENKAILYSLLWTLATDGGCGCIDRTWHATHMGTNDFCHFNENTWRHPTRHSLFVHISNPTHHSPLRGETWQALRKSQKFRRSFCQDPRQKHHSPPLRQATAWGL